MRSSHSMATYSSTSCFLGGSATKRHAHKNAPRHTHRSSSDVISVTAIGPFREQSSSARDRRNSVSAASFSGRTTRTSSLMRRRQTERTSRIESKNNGEENERTRVHLFPFFSFLFLLVVICEFYRIFRKEKNHGSSSLFAFVMHRSLRKFSCSLFPTNHLLSTLQTSYKPPSSCLPSHRQSPSLSPT